MNRFVKKTVVSTVFESTVQGIILSLQKKLGFDVNKKACEGSRKCGLAELDENNISCQVCSDIEREEFHTSYSALRGE